LLVVSFALPPGVGSDSARTRELYRTVAERIAALPGVAAVTASSTAPFSGGSSSSPNEIEGRALGPGEYGPSAQHRVVMPGFFQTMGIPIVAGRAIGEEDRVGSDPVVVVSEALAKRDFPSGDAIGRHIKHQSVWRLIVGIAGDVKYRGLALDDEATVYVPYTQRANVSMQMLIRTRVPTASMTAQVKTAILAAAPGAMMRRTDVMTELVKKSVANERFRTLLVSLFGVLAAVLASVGLYGVTARAVSQRRREVAIRVALGASTRSVVTLIVRATLSGVSVGIATGLIVAVLAARWAGPLLYGIDARDPVTYGAIVLLLAGISVAASWLPARRAARVQPASVLRGE
jgi:predicted permease